MNDNFTELAKIKLDNGSFEIVKPGDYVECSITGKKIALSYMASPKKKY